MDARFGVRKYFASNFITAMNATPEVFCHAIGDLSYKAVLASKMGPLRSNSSRHLFFFFPVTKIIPRGANQILRVFFYSYSPVTIFTGSDWIFFEHPGVGNYLCS